jgi:diaminopimelate epimerase
MSLIPGLTSILAIKATKLRKFNEEVPLKNPSLNTLPFTKMHGAGNDFVLIDAEHLLGAPAGRMLLKSWCSIAPGFARQLCNRRFSIGADGLVLSLNLKNAELKELATELYGNEAADCELAWVYTDSDGSLPETCGNALRCLTLWARNRNLIKDKANVCTKAGPVKVSFDSASKITVDLGEPSLLGKDIPFGGANGSEQIIKGDFALANNHFPITCVNVGNPHCIIFQAEFMEAAHPQLPLAKEAPTDFFPPQLEIIARQIQKDKRFPESTNVEFVYVTARNRAEVFVLERGAGATLACGSGACAALVAGVLENRLERESTMLLPGGALDVSWSTDDNHVRLTGPAHISFMGEVCLSDVFAVLESRLRESTIAAPRNNHNPVWSTDNNHLHLPSPAHDSFEQEDSQTEVKA